MPDLDLERCADAIMIGKLLERHAISQAYPVQILATLDHMNRRPRHRNGLTDAQRIGRIETIGAGQVRHADAATLGNLGQGVIGPHGIAGATIHRAALG